MDVLYGVLERSYVRVHPAAGPSAGDCDWPGGVWQAAGVKLDRRRAQADNKETGPACWLEVEIRCLQPT